MAAAVAGPHYISAKDLHVPSAAHEDYHPRAIQLYGKSAHFDGTTNYRDVYKRWALPAKPPPPSPSPRTLIPFQAQTAYHDSFPAHPVQARMHHEAPPYVGNPAKLDGHSTYAVNYTTHKIERRPPLPPRALFKNPALFDPTTNYNSTYIAHAIAPRKAVTMQYKYQPLHFEGTTEKQDRYREFPFEKQLQRPPPPMRPTLHFDGTTAYRSEFKGWQLPASRGSLGIAIVGDALHTLIPTTARAPCSVKQIFTTVHPGQTDVGLLLYQGDAHVASRNRLLGQFHLVGLPPAPVGVPQIEVTFHLSGDNVFTAEARDLDSGRQYLWTGNNNGAMLALPAAA